MTRADSVRPGYGTRGGRVPVPAAPHGGRGDTLRAMPTGEGRSPKPPHGDPNVKSVQVSLAPGEWRELRLLAAESDRSVGLQVAEIVREELRRRADPG